MSPSGKNERIARYDVLRVAATLLVVLSHSRYFMLETPYGGCNYSNLAAPELLITKLLLLITEFVNTITMPVFMALGGALFFKSMARGKFSSLGVLALDKAKRLLIPFLVVGTLYSFPLKLLTGYYSASENILLDFIQGQVLLQGNTHLWFLPAMFVVFCIVYVLETYVKIPKSVKLTVMAGLSVVIWNHPIHILAYSLRNLVWFYAGYCFESQRGKDMPFLGLWTGLFGMVTASWLFLGIRIVHSTSSIHRIIYLLTVRLLVPAVAALALYAVACWTEKTKVPSSRIFRWLSRNSFGIYLYSDPVNYVILYMGAMICGSFLFGDSLGILLMYVLRFTVTLVCAALVSELLRRCKMKYIV